MHPLQFPAGSLKVACSRSAGSYYDSIILFRQLRYHLSTLNSFAIAERDTLFFHQGYSAVYHGLVELEVWDAIAQQTSCCLVFLYHRHLISHQVQLICSCQTSRPGSHHSHALTVSLRVAHGDIPLTECSFNYCALILTVGSRLMVVEVQHAGLLTQRRTDASGKLGEGVCG